MTTYYFIVNKTTIYNFLKINEHYRIKGPEFDLKADVPLASKGSTLRGISEQWAKNDLKPSKGLNLNIHKLLKTIPGLYEAPIIRKTQLFR